MMIDQNYQKKVERVVESLYLKYVSRKDIFEPLSKILPNYWNDIFFTAVKNVMFKRVVILPSIKNAPSRRAWMMIRPERSVNEIAKEILEQEKLLKSIIWHKNGWGDPYRKPEETKVIPTGFEYKYITDSGSTQFVSLMDFKRRYTHVLRLAGIANNVNDSLVEAIYKTILDAYDTGIVNGVKMGKKSFSDDNNDKLVDIYNNIELSIVDLKKLIDKH